MDLRQHPEAWVKDRYDWAAVAVLLPFVAAAVVIAAVLGVPSVGVVFVAGIVGYAGSLLRRPLAARFRAPR
jgi:hypothetical protein